MLRRISHTARPVDAASMSYGRVDNDTATVAIAIAVPTALLISSVVLLLGWHCNPKRRATPIFSYLPSDRNPAAANGAAATAQART